MPKGSSAIVVSFEAFLESWLVRQEHYLDELLTAKQNCHESRDEDLNDLIARVVSHYRQYYDEKSLIAQQNILLVFRPTWLTSLECTLLWIAGFKPGLLFRVVKDSVDDLSEQQNERMNSLIQEVREEERMLNDEYAKIQEGLAAPPLLAWLRQCGSWAERELVRNEGAMLSTLRTSTKELVEKANLLRIRTVVSVVEILSPVQNVKFLTAVTQLQLRIRSWGLQKDSERRQSNRNW